MNQQNIWTFPDVLKQKGIYCVQNILFNKQMLILFNDKKLKNIVNNWNGKFIDPTLQILYLRLES